jgi:DNA polymerase-1
MNRAYYGIPLLSSSAGVHTNAVYGFLNILFKVLEEEQAQYLAVAFDLSAPTFRHKKYEAYKGTRHAMPDELREQIPIMQEMLRDMGVPLMMLEGYEADDLIGTASKKAEEEGLEVRIISGDRDLLQLASDRTMIRIPKTKKSGTEVEDYLASDVKERYLVTPEEFIDVKALMGDASDNIPGIPGVGEKTAVKIIAQYGSTDGIRFDHYVEAWDFG